MSLGPLMVDVAGRSLLPEDREVLEHPLVGGVILFTRNYQSPEQLIALVEEIRAVRSPSLLIAVDHEGGRVQRFRDGFTRVPPMRRIGQQYGIDRAAGREWARETGWLIGAELRAVGVDLAFTPCVDLDYGISEVIGDRALHSDAEIVATLGIDLMNGLREAGMSATAKHFPGHGFVAADSHVALPVDRRELADLGAEITPYRRMIINGLPSVMMAHVVFPDVDSLPASLSARWIKDILRRELDFRGAVFTDDLSMAGAVAFGGVVERARLALEAGADMLPVCNSRAAVHELLDALPVVSNPVSALRLARVHGRQGEVGPGALEALRAQARWKRVNAMLDPRAPAPPPPLELKG